MTTVDEMSAEMVRADKVARGLCEGSGLPTRTSGHCDRCHAANVRGDYIRTDPTDPKREGRGGPVGPDGRVFVVCPSFGYYVAVEHRAEPS